MIHAQISGTPIAVGAHAWFGRMVEDRTRVLAKAEHAILDAPRREIGRKIEEIAVHGQMLRHLQAMEVMYGDWSGPPSGQSPRRNGR